MSIDNVTNIMMELIRSEVCGAELSINTCDISVDTLSELYKLSKNQDLAHVVASALLSRGLVPDGELKNAFQQEQMSAVFRHAQIRHELSRLCRALSAEGISYMPLKGSVIRKYYTKPEMRTSCDIDIFVHHEDLDAACAVMTDKLGYKFYTRTPHDISYFSKSKVHVELHFDLIEDDDDVRTVLERVWDETKEAEEFPGGLVMNNEMYLTYHVAHMAKHFLSGGCGVRTILDLWIINHKMGYDRERALSLLSECKLQKFALEMMNLSEVWFGSSEHNSITRELEAYLVPSSVYGTVENRVAVAKQKRGGGLRYCFSRIFMPYSKLKKIYPRLEKFPILFPFYQVKRWFRFVFRGRMYYARAEIAATRNVSREKQDRIGNLCKMLEIGKE